LFAVSHIGVSLQAQYSINICSNSGDITQNKLLRGIFCLANFFFAELTTDNTLVVAKAIQFQAVPHTVPSSTVDVAFPYSHRISAST